VTSPVDRRVEDPTEGFRPDLEGLRAVAVVLVLLYHASVPGASGGYVGVDVFSTPYASALAGRLGAAIADLADGP
jgi:hypothetical protein